jgi:hypothetical protein
MLQFPPRQNSNWLVTDSKAAVVVEGKSGKSSASKDWKGASVVLDIVVLMPSILMTVQFWVMGRTERMWQAAREQMLGLALVPLLSAAQAAAKMQMKWAWQEALEAIQPVS